VVLKGDKLYVYKGQNLTKPESMRTFGSSMAFKEVRKADVGGKTNVLMIEFGEKGGEHVLASAASSDALQKWLRAL